jgi:hypothetical protein
MSLTVGQVATAANGTGTTLTTSAIVTTAGSGVLIGIHLYNAGGVTFSSLTSSTGESLTQVGTELVSSNFDTSRLYYLPNTAGNANHTFTLTCSASTYKNIYVVEVDTTNGAGLLLDQQARQNDDATPFVSPNITTTIANTILYGMSATESNDNPTTHTAGNSFTIQGQVTNGSTLTPGAHATRLVTATGTYQTSWTMTGIIYGTSQWIASFSEAAASSVSVTPGTATLTLATFIPTILTPFLATALTASLALASFAPTVTVSNNQLIVPTTASLAVSTFAPTVSTTANQSVTPTTALLTTATFAPTVSVSNHQLVTPTTASLSLASFAPTVTASDHQTVTPTTAALTLTTFAPTVTTTANQTVTPDTAALTLSLFAPTVTTSGNQSVTPTTVALTLATFAPTVTASGNQSVTPTTAALTTATFAPTVTTTAHQLVTPSTASLNTATFAPTVAVTDHQTVTPTTAALTLTTFAPTVTVTAPQTVTPATAALVTALFAPTVTVSNLTPATPVASPGGGGGIDWQRGPSKKRRYREKELFDELVHTMRDLLHPPVPVVARMDTPPALVVAHDVDIEDTYAKLAAIAAEHDEFQARLDEMTRALRAYQETQTRLRERLVRQDEEDAILLMMEMI